MAELTKPGGTLVAANWYGGAVEKGLEAATLATVGAVTKAAARYARANHPWHSRTVGGLEDSIFAAEPEIKGDHIYSIWGAHFPALYLEYGTAKMPAYPFLRPAAAATYRLANFAGDIRLGLAGSEALSVLLI
jgi:hypothetical protein